MKKIYLYSKQYRSIMERISEYDPMLNGEEQVLVLLDGKAQPWRKSDTIKITKEDNPEYWL